MRIVGVRRCIPDNRILADGRAPSGSNASTGGLGRDQNHLPATDPLELLRDDLDLLCRVLRRSADDWNRRERDTQALENRTVVDLLIGDLDPELKQRGVPRVLRWPREP